MNALYRISRKDKNLEVPNDESVIYGVFTETDAKIIGFCVVTYHEQPDKTDHVFIESLCEDTKYIGITKRLLSDLARFKNITKVVCHVYGGILENGYYAHDRYNRGLGKFYKSLGFQDVELIIDSKNQRFYVMEFNTKNKL
jgi:L-amino acid N-acyltransferase YncA